MSLSLEKRIENCTKAICLDVLAGTPDFYVFGDNEATTAEYYSVRADRVEEDPHGSGIFTFNVTVVAKGRFDTTELVTLETLFSNSWELTDLIRTEALNHDFTIIGGDACDIGIKSKSGSGLDQEHRYEFGLWAQASEYII